jgi:putative transposase
MLKTIDKPLRIKSFLSDILKHIEMRNYPSDLTDSQWQVIENLINNGRKRKYGMRTITDALLYITKSGCQWRMLPKNYPPWESVYYYFRKWKSYGIIEEVHDYLVSKVRKKSNKKETPSVGIIDSQSAKAINVCQGGLGYDGGKKIKGRKRHIVVDTLGMVLAVVIHPANIHDSKAAIEVFQALKDKYINGIVKIFADGGYQGETLSDWAKQKMGWIVEVVKRNETGKFKVLPKRWIVERTFAWISFQRRMSKDYERYPESSQAFVHLSMVRVMLNRF